MLTLHLYDNSMTSPKSLSSLVPIAGSPRILWEIPGGVQAIEFDYGTDPTTAYEFYANNLGNRVVVLDQYLGSPVAEGWIFGVAITQFGCRVLCKGAWARHFDQFDDTAYSLAQTSSAVIEASLGGFVPVVSPDYSGIEETGFTLNATGTWDLSEYGMYPGDIIVKLLSMSNSDLKQWNYWVQSAPLRGTIPQRPTAHLEEQVDDGTFNWQISKADLGADALTMERNLDDFASSVLVVYRDIVDNEQSLTTWATEADAASAFWTREVVLSGGEMVPDGATQYRDMMLAKLKDPVLARSFLITSSRIKDDAGTAWPLWYPIKRGGGYLRINDLFPMADVFYRSSNSRHIGQIMTAEYDDTQHSLRISLDTSDDRADALLAQMGLI
jgi:hypothetical protein